MALSQNSIVKESDWQHFFWIGILFMAGPSVYGLFTYAILYWVTLATFFATLFLLHIYSQVATKFTFIRGFSVELLSRRRHFQNTLSLVNPNFIVSRIPWAIPCFEYRHQPMKDCMNPGNRCKPYNPYTLLRVLP